jgi:tRNA1(Val) A37 N6-methylase TrmN6
MIDFNLPYSKSKFIPFLEGFLPEDYREHNEEITIPFQTKYFEKVNYLGETGKLNLAVYEVQHTSENDARVGLTREMFRLMAAFGKRRSLVILVPKTGYTYRFSLVTIDLKLDENNRITKEYSNPKRYSFILGENAKIHTPNKFLVLQGRVSGFEDLQSRFSVEVVNKEFYKRLFEWFIWATGEVQFPSGKNEEDIIRFISRIMFVWFLKEMKLVPNELFDKKEVYNLLYETSETKSSYYKAILQNLFFATLNTSMRKDLKANEAQVREFLPYGKVTNKHGLQYYYRYKEMLNEPERLQQLLDGVPFLNGGLFECLDERKNETEGEDIWIDGFTQNIKHNDLIHFPNKLFFEPEKGLLDLFHLYNFTVEESSPIDQNVGLDPEMLGSVFENLLASFNPETRENARNATGSFYTPKQVVDFMATESLKQYLKKEVPEINENQLLQLFDYVVEENPFDKTTSKKIIASLAKIKILDIACGSGAFPMGLLNRITLALHKIDPGNELWKNQQLDNIPKEDYKVRKIEIERIFNQNDVETNYARKLFIIENAINGVDIQPIAIQISKLRFFLSLVIEQKIDPDAVNKGIIPLPNLETRFVCADALLKLSKPEDLTFPVRRADITIFGEVIPRQMNMFIETNDLPHIVIESQLKKVRHSYFEAKTIETKRKYRELDKELREKLGRELKKLGYPGLESTKIAEWNPYDKSKTAQWFDPEFMLGIEAGFDIVTGNPPYIQLLSDKGILAEKYKDFNYETYNRSGDIYCLFYERAIKLLKNNGIISFITSNRFCFTNYGVNLRKFLSNYKLQIIINLNEISVFGEANVGTLILIAINSKENGNVFHICELKNKNQYESFNQRINNNSWIIESKYFNTDQWSFYPNDILRFRDKLKKKGKPFHKIDDIKINRGITTGLNNVFIIDETKKKLLTQLDSKSEEILKPVLKGANIKKWVIHKPNNYLIYSYTGINIDNYYSVKTYLNEYKEALSNVYEARNNQKKWYELRACTYYDSFFKTKIIWTRLSNQNCFAISSEGEFSVDSTSFAVGKNLYYYCSILNSKLVFFYFKLGSVIWGKDGIKWFGDYFDSIPIIPANEHTNNLFESKYFEMINDIETSLDTNVTLYETQIDLMVYKLYELTYDEAMIVDPELEQIILREDYERAGIEEMAEWVV